MALITVTIKNYVRIEFKNCGTPYDYTICPYNKLDDQLLIAQSSLEDYDPANDEEYGKPEIIITPIQMDEAEFEVLRQSWWDETM